MSESKLLVFVTIDNEKETVLKLKQPVSYARLKATLVEEFGELSSFKVLEGGCTLCPGDDLIGDKEFHCVCVTSKFLNLKHVG